MELSHLYITLESAEWALNEAEKAAYSVEMTPRATVSIKNSAYATLRHCREAVRDIQAQINIREAMIEEAATAREAAAAVAAAEAIIAGKAVMS